MDKECVYLCLIGLESFRSILRNTMRDNLYSNEENQLFYMQYEANEYGKNGDIWYNTFG